MRLSQVAFNVALVDGNEGHFWLQELKALSSFVRFPAVGHFSAGEQILITICSVERRERLSFD